MRQGTLDNLGGPPKGRAHPCTWRGKRFKAAVAAVSIVSLFALTALMGTADGVWAACAGALSIDQEQPSGTTNNGPYALGSTVRLVNTIDNNNATAFTTYCLSKKCYSDRTWPTIDVASSL